MPESAYTHERPQLFLVPSRSFRSARPPRQRGGQRFQLLLECCAALLHHFARDCELRAGVPARNPDPQRLRGKLERSRDVRHHADLCAPPLRKPPEDSGRFGLCQNAFYCSYLPVLI